MTRTVLLFVVAATICDAALIPLSPTWSSSLCARGYGGSANSALSCLTKPCPSDIDYNLLLSLLYPEIRFSSLDEGALNLVGACPCGGRCDLNEYCRGCCPELKTCGQCIDYEPFRSNVDCRDMYCNNGCECYPFDCFSSDCYTSECYPKCLNGGLGCCKCGYCCRKIPRLPAYRCKKLTGQCFPGQTSCI